MKSFIKILCISLMFSNLSVQSQEKSLERANKHYEDYAYADAIKIYENIVQESKADFEVYQKLSNSYYHTGDLPNAIKSYQYMVSSRKDLFPDHYFRNVLAMKNFEKYGVTDELIRTLKYLSEYDSLRTRLTTRPTYLRDITAMSGRYDISNMELNSSKADFAPTFLNKQLVFSSARSEKKGKTNRNKWMNQPYLSLFKGEIKESGEVSTPSMLSKKLDVKYHESTSCFTADGNTMYVTINNTVNIKIKSDKENDVVRLKIVKAVKGKDNNWSIVQEMPFNNDAYSVAHPSLSADGSKLYFASDMPGGFGMSDLYVVDISSTGEYGTPVNLGNEINTEGRDTFPFIAKDGILYFASDSHLGLGGFDMYATYLPQRSNEVVNLGKPVNSSYDDVTYVINSDTKKGFFASNRPEGKGDDDIYSFTENIAVESICYEFMETYITDEVFNNPIDSAQVEVKDENGNVIATGLTDENGLLSYQIDCNQKPHSILVKKEGYQDFEKLLGLENGAQGSTTEISMRDIRPRGGFNLNYILGLDPILYKYDDTSILNEAYQELNQVGDYLQQFPNVRIQIASHADSRGSAEYNFALSKKRSTGIQQYLVNKGININRLEVRGYGEAMLVTECNDYYSCSEEDHEKSRRTEFIIIGI